MSKSPAKQLDFAPISSFADAPNNEHLSPEPEGSQQVATEAREEVIDAAKTLYRLRMNKFELPYKPITSCSKDYVTRGGSIQYSVVDFSGDEAVLCPLQGKSCNGQPCSSSFTCPDEMMMHLCTHNEPLSFSIVVDEKYMTGVPDNDQYLAITLIKDPDGHPVYQKRTAGCCVAGCSTPGDSIFDCAGCCASFCEDHVCGNGMQQEDCIQFCNACLADKPRRDSLRVSLELQVLKAAGKPLPKRRTCLTGVKPRVQAVKRKELSTEEVSSDASENIRKLSKTDPALALYFQTAQMWAENMRIYLESRNN